MADPDAAILAKALLTARQSGKTVSTALLSTPSDLAAALESQAIVFQQLECVVRGWKVAIRPDGQVVSAPMSPFDSLGHEAMIQWFDGMGMEVELAFLLIKDLGPTKNGIISRKQVLGSIGAVHLGIEFVASRLTEGGAAPALLFLADALANNGYLLGQRLPFDGNFPGQRWNLSVSACGVTLCDGEVMHPSIDPLVPLVALANAPPGPLGGLKAGQVITTGSLCGVLPISKPGIVAIKLDDTTLRFHIKRRQPGFDRYDSRSIQPVVCNALWRGR